MLQRWSASCLILSAPLLVSVPARGDAPELGAAAESPQEEPAPRDVLQSKELRNVGSYWILPGEKELAAQLKTFGRLEKRVRDALRLQKDFERQIKTFLIVYSIPDRLRINHSRESMRRSRMRIQREPNGCQSVCCVSVIGEGLMFIIMDARLSAGPDFPPVTRAMDRSNPGLEVVFRNSGLNGSTMTESVSLPIS